MKLPLLLSVLFFSFAFARAQEGTTAADKEAAYTKTITGRAEKIVAVLDIPIAKKADKVRDIIINQYRALNAVYTHRDEQVKAAKEKAGTDKEALERNRNAIEEAATAATAALQKTYLKKLSAHLSNEQVSKVKDGMTYGVLPITYSGYLDMLPNLTAPQKSQIMEWLTEAREYAMRAESSDKKHWWFGKYKGRINNYLSAQGYDLKKESEAWHKRLEAKKEAKTG